MADKKYGSLEDFAHEVWGKRAEGLPVAGLDISRPISAADMDYIKRRYAFIQIVNPDAGPDENFDSIQIIPAKSGFTILHYGTAICASPAESLFGLPNEYKLDENGVYIPMHTGRGTRIKQIVDTAIEMVALTQRSKDAKPDEGVKKSWRSIYIVAGQDDFKWATWAAAQEHQLEIQGYTPSKEKEEIAKYERIKTVFTSFTHPVRETTPSK